VLISKTLYQWGFETKFGDNNFLWLAPWLPWNK
jgi:hypothetical protein